MDVTNSEIPDATDAEILDEIFSGFLSVTQCFVILLLKRVNIKELDKFIGNLKMFKYTSLNLYHSLNVLRIIEGKEPIPARNLFEEKFLNELIDLCESEN